MAINNERIDQLIGNAKTSEEVFGTDGLLKQLSKPLLERMLATEMTEHLGYAKHALEGNNSGNARNGTGRKTVKTGNGSVELEVPRDRAGDFSQALVGKRQTRLGGLDKHVLSLYGRGMTVRDIQGYVKDLYGTAISRDLISTITDGVLEAVRAWCQRPLERLYPIVYIDGCVVKCR